MSKLEIENVRLRFGAHEVLKGLSLNVDDGQLVTLLGPSGCGKTTLLRAVAGFVPIDSGSIAIGGSDMTSIPPERRDTAMCFQSYALFPHLTVAENIVFGLRQKRAPREEIARRLQSVASQVSLEAHLEKLPGQLSGGQQQRVALARALAVRPGVMLFDEPLSNLDAKLRDQVRLEIRQLQRDQGFTALYVTHDQSEALAMSDLMVVMNGGEIEQIGTPQEIYYKPVSRFVADFVGGANILPAQVLDAGSAASAIKVSTPIGQARIISEESPSGPRIYICWRPEDAEIVESGTEDNAFELEVRSRTFLGSITEVGVGLPNGEGPTFRVHTAGYADLDHGKTYRFRVAPDKLRLLREEVV